MSLNITHGIEFDSGDLRISFLVSRGKTMTINSWIRNRATRHAAGFRGNIDPFDVLVKSQAEDIPAKDLLNYTHFLRYVNELIDEMSTITSMTERSPLWLTARMPTIEACTGGVEDLSERWRILFAIASRPADISPRELAHVASVIADSQCIGEVTSVEGVKALAPATLEILRGLINDIEGLGDELFEPTSVPAFVAESFRKYQKAL